MNQLTRLRAHRKVCRRRQGQESWHLNRSPNQTDLGVMISTHQNLLIRWTDLVFNWQLPTKAASHSPAFIAFKARCSAVREELHAVST